MKIKILKECGFEVIEQINDDGDIISSYDETFKPNEIFDGDIVDENSEYCSFQFGDGSMIYGLKKELYEVISE